MADPSQDIVSTENYDLLGRTVNGRYGLLESSAQLWQKQGKLKDTLLLMSWQAELNRWRSWFHENIENTPMLPLHSTTDLEAFDTSVTEWRARLEKAAGASMPGVPPFRPAVTPSPASGILGDVAGVLYGLAALVVVATVASVVRGRK